MRIRSYIPANDPVNAFKATTRLLAAQQHRGSPLTGPVRVDVEFVFPRTKGQMWKTKPMPRLRHWKKPDTDNLQKSIYDALSGLMWIDDAQICDGRIKKWIAAGDEQPHVLITVTSIEEA